jgi:hypothetical protein
MFGKFFKNKKLLMIRMGTTTILDGTVYDKDRYHKKVTEELPLL